MMYVVEVEPQSKLRAVSTGKMINGKFKRWSFTPRTAASEKSEAMALEILKTLNVPKFGAEVPLRLKVMFYRTKTSTYKKTDTKPSKKPDIDNMTKWWLDILTKSEVIVDDAQVCSIFAMKRFAELLDKPRVEFEIEAE
jgi:Holliday junction resolvase RusA-like endonuclease